MDSVPTKSDEILPKSEKPKKVPGQIGVYERPEGIKLSSMLFMGLTGLVILILIALAVYVMLL